MPADLDLHAYLERIEYGGATRADHDTLAAVLRAHMLHIPFENLDVLLGRPIRLDLEGLQHKLVRSRRGGYCFEHGTLFAAVLERLGFQPVRHTARVVLLNARGDAARTHMFLKVPLAEGDFVVDPGFGALAARFPVPLAECAQPAADASHWMVRDGGYWVLRARIGAKVVDAWVSTLDLDNPIDFEVGNHFTSTWPASPFVNRMMLRAFTADGGVSVMNRDVTHTRGDASRHLQLAGRSALRELLVQHFGFDLPQVETLRVPSIPEWT